MSLRKEKGQTATAGAYWGGLGVEGGEPVLEGVHVVILPSDEGLARYVVDTGPLGRLELFMVRSPACWVDQAPRYPLHLTPPTSDLSGAAQAS